MNDYLWIILVIVLYVSPSIIAHYKKMKSAGEITVVNLLVGWTVIGWIISLFWALGGEGGKRSEADRLERLEKRIEDLLARVMRLEKQVESRPLRTHEEKPAVFPAPSVPPISVQPTVPPVSARPAEVPGGREPPSPEVRWPPPPPGRPEVAPIPSQPLETGVAKIETLIGGKWALYVGSLLVFFALAFFLNYFWENITPAWRIAIGFISGTVFLGLGEWQKKSAAAWFHQGITGAGLGFFYLTIWAGFQIYARFSFDVAFTLMALTTALGVALALRYDAVSLQVLATVGGFLTPVLLRTPGTHAAQAIPFLSYVAILNAGILITSLFKRWREVNLLAFALTVILLFGWAEENYSSPLLMPFFSFITLYFWLFLGTSTFYSLLHKEPTHERDLILLFADTLVYSWAGYELLLERMGEYPGTFPLVMAVLFFAITMGVRTLAPQNPILQRSTGAISLFFLTIAVPIQLKQGWIAVAWSVEGAILSTLAIPYKGVFFRLSSFILWFLALTSVWWVLEAVEVQRHLLIINEKGLPLLVFVLASAWMGWKEREWARIQGKSMEAVFLYAAVLGGAWLVAQETFFAFQWNEFPSSMSWQAGAMFAIACLTAIYALSLFAAGMKTRQVHLLIPAILVMSIATVLPLWASATQTAPGWLPFLNLRGLAYLVVVASLAGMAYLLARNAQALYALMGEESPFPVWTPLIASLIAIIGISIEIYQWFDFWEIPSLESWQIAAFFTMAQLWFVFALLLLILGVKMRQMPFRVAGYILTFLALFLILTQSVTAVALDWLPFFNWRFLAFLIGATALLTVPWAIGGVSEASQVPERGILTTAIVAGAIIGIWGLTQETYETFRYYREFFVNWTRAAQMGISLVWAISGAVLVIFGIYRRVQSLRILALVLFGFTVFKVFLIDLSFLPSQYRVLSFGGLGLILISISYLYSRYSAEIRKWTLGKPGETKQ